MLHKIESILTALQQNRCVLSRCALLTGESVFSRQQVPTLYETRLSSSDKARVRGVVEALVAHSDELQLLIHADPAVKQNLRLFFGRSICHADSTDEAFLHAYIFLFWDDFRSQVKLGRPLHYQPAWGSSEYGARSTRELSTNEAAVSRQLQKAGVEVDLYSYDAETETLALIELKRGESDDRAVGQMLRYYKVVWGLLSQPDFRKLNINYVWPILVLNRVQPDHIQALPVHFRGVLDIVVYTSVGDEAPTFSSFRRAAFSNRWM
jgi:hypothetical protein